MFFLYILIIYIAEGKINNILLFAFHPLSLLQHLRPTTRLRPAFGGHSAPAAREKASEDFNPFKPSPFRDGEEFIRFPIVRRTHILFYTSLTKALKNPILSEAKHYNSNDDGIQHIFSPTASGGRAKETAEIFPGQRTLFIL